MSIVMQLQDVAESTRLGPLSGEVRAGEILHLVGPNGAGKSTLLARMAGMTSGKGSIQFAGQPLEAWSATKLALHRAYLSQQQTPPFAMPVWHYLTLHQHDKTRTELLNDVAGALALDDKFVITRIIKGVTALIINLPSRCGIYSVWRRHCHHLLP